MSVFDDYAAQRRAEAQEAHQIANVTAMNAMVGDGKDAGPGHVLGVVCMVGGIGLCLIGMIGLGIFGVVGGLFLIGGRKVTQDGLDAMEAAVEDGPAAVTEAAGIGCATLIGYIVIGVAILIGLFMALAGAGMMAGVTL